jgi:hypothetical protein
VRSALMSGAPRGAQWLRPPWCCAAPSGSSPVRPLAYARSRAQRSHQTRSVPGKSSAALWRPAATSARSVGAFAGLQLPSSRHWRQTFSSSFCRPRKKCGELLSPHRSAGSRPGGPRVCLYRSRCPRVPGAPGRAHLALGGRNYPGALCPPPRRLLAQSAALASASTPAETESDQTRGVPQTSGVGTLSLLESGDQWRVAQRSGGRPIWHLESLL